MTKNLSESPENIIKRLEKLRQWQEEQQKILVEKQITQRQLLNLEQQKMYEMLGLSRDLSEEDVSHFNYNEAEKSAFCEEITNIQKQLPLNTQKKQFLKRGEGLKSRFKMDPDAFRLQNLPKYKYANAHKKFLQKRTSRVDSKSVVHNRHRTQLNLQKLKKQGSKISERNIAQFNEIHGDNLELKIPEIATTIQEKCNIRTESPAFNSENNLESNKCNENTDVSQNFIEETKLNNSNNVSNKSQFHKISELSSENSKTEDIEPISWAKVLDPSNPISIHDFRRPSSILESKSQQELEELENISLFELLEKKAEEGSFTLNFSSIRRWVANKKNFDCNMIEEENENQSTIIEAVKSKISPVPFDIEKRIVLDESDEESSDSEGNPNQCKGRVHFSDNVQVNELESDAETVLSNELDSINVSKTSTPNDKILFEKFKAELFAANENSEKYDSTLVDDKNLFDEKKQEILEKSELLKSRLVDLENEITVFKQHNAELTRLKQEHELEKIQLKQEKMEIEEKLNDERIKIEIYLHDERMKIEEEKKKIEKVLKEKKPNRKEREEISKLRDQVESLQKELKNKESKHVAAQSRLRAQIRIFEKEIKELNFETDHLKKEIKKLESENARLNRINNTKMLQEINKTIAKLAPKVVSTKVI